MEREVNEAILVYIRFILDITLIHCVKTHAKRVNKLLISNELSKPQLCRSSRMDSVSEMERISVTRRSRSFLVATFLLRRAFLGGGPLGCSLKSGDASTSHSSRPIPNSSSDSSI